jgi:hypothetical protein
LHEEDVTSDAAAEFFEKVKAGAAFKSAAFANGVTINPAVVNV